MKFIVQRVKHASVTIDEKLYSNIEKGFLVLVGIGKEDTKTIADKMLQKLLKLRIFEDENGKTNLSIKDINGSMLMVSQFTLYADCRKGNRPSFVNAGAPEMSEALYQYLVDECHKEIPDTKQGVFGADMKVELLNDGPFTIVLDSEEVIKKN